MSADFPKFEDIEVSTKTIIAVTNLLLDIGKLFESLPITDYQVVPKRRGRKKRDAPADPNINVPMGSIITLKYQGNLRGVDLKNGKKSKSAKKGYFRNSLTVVMLVDNKILNFKISDNGKFQITGCKKDEHAFSLIQTFYQIIRSHNLQDCYRLEEDFYAVFITVMTNIDFNLGFQINRENLDKWINNRTDYNSLLETSFGYTGVNIKIPFSMPRDLYLKKLNHNLDENNNDVWKESRISYICYLDILTDKERRKEINKSRYNTFLVFHSGNCIFSSMHKDFMKIYYEEFLSIVQDCRQYIEENVVKSSGGSSSGAMLAPLMFPLASAISIEA